MKTKFRSLPRCLAIVVVMAATAFVCGCASVERTAYITTGGLTTAVELARQAYVQHENDCLCVTQSEHDKVLSYYEKYQRAAELAERAIIAYKSSTVPDKASLDAIIASSAVAANDVLAMIESYLPVSEKTKLTKQLPKGVTVTQ